MNFAACQTQYCAIEPTKRRSSNWFRIPVASFALLSNTTSLAFCDILNTDPRCFLPICLSPTPLPATY